MKRDRRIALAFAAILVGAMWTAAFLQERAIDERSQRAAEERAQAAVRSYEDYVSVSLDLIENFLRFVAAYYVENGQDATIDLVSRQGLYGNMPGLVAVVDVEGHGRAVGSLGSIPIDLSDQETIRVAREEKDERLVVGKPVPAMFFGLARQEGGSDRLIPFARPVRRADGQLVGFVSTRVPPGLFSRFYNAAVVGEHGVIGLIGTRDHLLRARGARAAQPVGQDLSAAPLWLAFRNSPEGVFTGTSAVDGVLRVLAYRKLEKYPLVVTAGVAMDEVRAESGALRRNVIVAASAGTCVVIVVLLAFLQQQALRIRLRQSNDRLEDEVERRSSQLAAEIERRRHREGELRIMYRVFEQNPNMVIVTDGEGRIEFVNQAFTRLSGYASREVVGMDATAIFKGEAAQQLASSLSAVLASRSAWRGEIADRRKDGSAIWVSAIISPVSEGNGTATHFVILAQDVTERKLAEFEMAEARRQAEAANRAKSELLANMSHELRTPLNAVIGFSSAMRKQLFGPLGHPKYKEYSDDINASGQHLLALINDILDVSAIEAGKATLHEESFSLADALDACLRLIAPRAEAAGVALRREAAVLPLIHADLRRMKQILINLLSNGVKFTPRGGMVTVATSAGSDGELTITVNDTGIGMDAEGLVKAMQPFGQIHSELARKYEGIGLGLPLTKSLVELHGGTLAIDSRREEGTTVTVTLPASRVMAPAG